MSSNTNYLNRVYFPKNTDFGWLWSQESFNKEENTISEVYWIKKSTFKQGNSSELKRLAPGMIAFLNVGEKESEKCKINSINSAVFETKSCLSVTVTRKDKKIETVWIETINDWTNK